MALLRAADYSKPQLAAPRAKLEYSIPYFSGIDTTSDPASSPETTSNPNAMEETSSPDTLNTVFDKVQSVGSRKGYTKLLTTSLTDFIGGMYSLYQSSGAKQLVYASDANLYKYNNAGGSTQLTGAPATFTPNNQWSFDELLDDVYGGNGVDPLIVYNGTNYSIANAAITPQFLKVRTNRVYCANQNSSTLYFSDAGTPSSFPVNNFIQINTNDGQNITGIDSLLDTLVIFKDESVWLLTGEPLGAGNLTTIGNLQLKQANSPVGCSAFRTIQHVEQTLFFMHWSGIYMLQNTSVVLVSPLLKATFQNGMSSAFLNLSWAVYNSLENKYICGYPSAAAVTPDSAIIYDLTSKQFSLWDNIPGGCAVNYKFSGTQESVLFADPNKGNIYELFQGYADIFGDNGTATAGSSTSLTDSTKTWVASALIDCRIMIVGGTATGSEAVITANTTDAVTVASWSNGTPDSTSIYTIGWYNSYWKTKQFDFGMVGYVKKFRFWNFFIDSELYPIQFGYSIDFQPLAYQKDLNLLSGGLVWGSPLVWGPSTGNWGFFTSEFAQANIGNTGRYVQGIFGNNLANQPWRVSSYSISYKLKKLRPNIVTT
jgi:hypothetical protein